MEDNPLHSAGARVIEIYEWVVDKYGPKYAVFEQPNDIDAELTNQRLEPLEQSSLTMIGPTHADLIALTKLIIDTEMHAEMWQRHHEGMAEFDRELRKDLRDAEDD